MVCDAPPPLRRSVEGVLEVAVVSARALPGSSSFAIFRVALADGRHLAVKSAPGDGSADFAAEATGLQWLAEARAIRTPEVVAVHEPPPAARGEAAESGAWLALEFIAPGHRGRDFDEALGRKLAALHRQVAPCFGLDRPNRVGAIEQANDPRPDWPTFYGEMRLAPLVRRTRDDGSLAPRWARALDALLPQLPQRCGPIEPPARLHGDLWAGNVLCAATGEPVLIDPAVYGGHREVDLAMMTLFGGFSDRCFAAYDEVWPRAPGAAEREALYQLYPLLVHIAMFGGSYNGALGAALAKLV